LAARGCHGCDLYKRATQTVFGEGSSRSPIVLVGEQPGDREDIAGLPFVGPAGALLRRALDEAGIAADDVYITNAVKHFRYVERGKRRIHQKPETIQIEACHPWLEAEIEAVRPRAIVALGATAARSLFGRAVRVTSERGKALSLAGGRIAFVTIHPSNVLRQRDSDARHAEFAGLVADLHAVAQTLRATHGVA